MRVVPSVRRGAGVRLLLGLPVSLRDGGASCGQRGRLAAVAGGRAGTRPVPHRAARELVTVYELSGYLNEP